MTKADMSVLLKSIFGPNPEKIEKVMQFFAMVGGSEGAINQDNFINGMTLLYGDLGQLAASPTLPGRSDGLRSPITEHQSPTGLYATRGEDGIFGSPLAPGSPPAPGSPLAPGLPGPESPATTASNATMSPAEHLPPAEGDMSL